LVLGELRVLFHCAPLTFVGEKALGIVPQLALVSD